MTTDVSGLGFKNDNDSKAGFRVCFGGGGKPSEGVFED